MQLLKKVNTVTARQIETQCVCNSMRHTNFETIFHIKFVQEGISVPFFVPLSQARHDNDGKVPVHVFRSTAIPHS